jgi:hypothetical protein
MTMNFSEQKLDYIWSNFARGHLGKKILEQGAHFKQTALTQFLDSNTSTPERLARTKHISKISP